MAYAVRSAPASQPPPPTPSGQSPVWLERMIETLEKHWRWALGTLALIDVAILLYMGRGLSFFFDDWDFVTHDFGGGIGAMLHPHVGNISIFPIAVYKILFHVVGLNHYAVYRLVVIGLHLAAVGLIFVLTARRIPRVPALLVTSLILFLGAAWEDLLWAFQIGYMLSIVGGLGAWALMERDDRRGDFIAMLCLIIAVGSSSLGIPAIVGIAVELAWLRQARRAWLVAIPAALYLAWYLGYGESEITRNGLINAPGYVEDLAAAAFGGLIGRALEWGRPLALLGVVVVVRRLIRPLPVTPRLAGLLATVLSLWIVTAVARSTISPPETSRYIYFGAVVIVLIGVELLSEIAITSRAVAIATVFVAFFAVTGLTVMHAGATGLRETSKTVTVELGALEMAAAYAPPGYQPDAQLAPQIEAGSYIHTVRAMGSSPADTPNEIVAADPAARAAADKVLLALEVSRLTQVANHKPLESSAAPSLISVEGASQAAHGGCVQLAILPGQTTRAVFAMPGSGVFIADNGKAPASVAVKRFADEFHPIAGDIAPLGDVMLTIPSDAGSVRWVFQVTSASPLSVCGLRG